MLMSVLKILVKNPVKENFDITFIEMKNAIKTLIVFFSSFLIKTFFNYILNQCPKDTRLYFPFIIITIIGTKEK